MPHFPYVIVGGGMAAHAAIRGIREVDPDGPIALIGQEQHQPYKRPPLTKGLWKGEALDSIWYPSDMPGVNFYLGHQVTTVLPKEKAVTDDKGERYDYDKLLLATGGRPRRLDLGQANDYLIYFRTADDYRRLRALAETSTDFAVVGAGFIGSELAAALALNGKHVTMIFPGDAIARAVLPREEALFLNDYYQKRGVTLRPNHTLVGAERQGEKLIIRSKHKDTGEETADTVDGAVVAVTAFEDWDDLLVRANNTRYGLAAGAWTRDVSKAHRFARAAKAGTVWINSYGLFDPAAPFGGYKESGFGREMGREALDLYTQTKTVWLGL